VSALLLLAACEPTYETPPAYGTSPVTTSPSAMYAAPMTIIPTAPSRSVLDG